jgi:hypothetical protein
MPLTVLVDREGRIAISHAGVVDPLVFEADINALKPAGAFSCWTSPHQASIFPISMGFWKPCDVLPVPAWAFSLYFTTSIRPCNMRTV